MLDQALRQVADRLEDAWYLALLGPDGIAIESLELPGHQGLDLELVCVETASLLRALAQSQEEFDDGSVASLAVSLDKAQFVLSRFDDDVYLLAVASKANPLSRLQFELRRISLHMQDLLS